jgi:phage tail tape-measure protein
MDEWGVGIRGRMTSAGLSGLTGFFEKYRREKSSGMRSRIFKHAGAETNECHKSSLR